MQFHGAKITSDEKKRKDRNAMKSNLILLAFAGLLIQGCFGWSVHGEVDDRGRGRIEGTIGSDAPRYETGRSYVEGDYVIVYHGDRPPFVPPGHLPPPGHARVWYLGRPPGQQPPPYRIP